ncbi:hypothetical protein HAX54_045389 [Datura stramonium]|uniref:Uncharacterized protein n=1 Tax=Datura stramonium TaxID=4076 RepID=A0ABS8WJL5_DATST|nr:hypothetical protein [Datura stramonium]
MATDASQREFQQRDLLPVPQPPDYHPVVAVSPAHDGLHFWQFMVAGSIAGTVEHMAMFLNTNQDPNASPSIRKALEGILKSEGLAGLYRGIGAMGLGAGPAHAVYFSVYESCKKRFSGGNPNNSAAHAISGVFATVASDAFYTDGYGEAEVAAGERESASDERLIVHATAGAAAGASAARGATPLDVVKTQLQCQGICGCDRFKSGSIGDVFRIIEEG